MRKWLKRLRWLIPLLVGLGLIIGVLVLSCAVCREEKAPEAVKEGWVKADKKKTSTVLDKLNPLKKTPSRADDLLKEWPRGTKIVEIQPREEITYIAIPPSGDVLTPEGVEGVTVYEKPERDWGLKFRPFIGAGLSTNGPGALVGVDVFKVWKVHVGPGINIAIKNKNANVAGVGALGFNVWRNIDLKGYGGATFDGERVFGGGVTIGIQ